MYETILKALKAKFEGVSENVLSRIATKLAKTANNSEQAQSAVEAYTLQQMLESYADSRATEATQTAVHNYETKYGLKDGAKVEKTGEQEAHLTKENEGGESVPEWAKQLQEANKKLLDRITQMETERTTSSRKKQLDAVIGKLPEAFRKGYERLSVDGITEEQFTSLLTEVTTEVDGIVKAANERGAVFGKPTATGSGSGTNDELTDEQMKAVAHREGIPSVDKQPF